MQYYKDKCHDLKELLAKCTDQLKDFEELNQMRNDVIEKLEKDNAQLKHQAKSTGCFLTSASTHSLQHSTKRK